MNAANLSKIKDDKGSSFHRQVSWDGYFSTYANPLSSTSDLRQCQIRYITKNFTKT